MKTKSLILTTLLLVSTCFFSLWAQEVIPVNPESDMGGLEPAEDEFQELFFDAIRLKAIENYEPALRLMEKAQTIASNNEEKAVVLFEMGKLNFYLENVAEAITKYDQALEVGGEQKDILGYLYELYYMYEDYQKALGIVERLIPFDDSYRNHLPNLYYHLQKYDLALEHIHKLEDEFGEKESWNEVKSKIYIATDNADNAITELERRVEKHPENEKIFLDLIYFYIEDKEIEKAIAMTHKLLEVHPNSKAAHLFLYKIHFDNKNIDKALESMKIAFSMPKLKEESSFSIFDDFISFVELYPEYENRIDDALAIYPENKSIVYQRTADYFISRKNHSKALRYYEEAYAHDNLNFLALANMLSLQIGVEKYSEVVKTSTQALDIFPTQPMLYLINGIAHNCLKNYQKAIDVLEMGLDFLVDDPKMEGDFYVELSLAYKFLGNTDRAHTYSQKAIALKNAKN